MSEFIFRTEEMTNELIEEVSVLNTYERDIINKLKSSTPVLLVGERGVGKSFLFKMTQIQMIREFECQRVVPVMVTFRRASLLKSGNELQFHHWMIGRIGKEIVRELKKRGLIASNPSCSAIVEELSNNQLDETIKRFEESWKSPGETISTADVLSIDSFLDAIEDICSELSLKGIVLLIDEAAHVFYPEQQRQFFTLFRDLRSPYITCKAAVYPGVTVYGDTFEPVHDALQITLKRNVNDENYVDDMKQMVLHQVKDSALAVRLSRNSGNFTLLAYAASGNPRYFLKSIEFANKMDSNSVDKVFREYYRTSLWGEHSKLSDRYPGYQRFIDWGRDFLEKNVIPEMKKKNDGFFQENRGKGTTLYFWIHKDVPQEVKEALRILEYSGLIHEDEYGIRATRSEVGVRYIINIGCLIAMESKPSTTGFKIIKESDIRRMTEYGKNHSLYRDIIGAASENVTDVLEKQLSKEVDCLELTEWQLSKLHEININTIGDLVNAEENTLKQARYIADIRARRLKNAGIAAVCEYLLG